jgi:hypothetical protein
MLPHWTERVAGDISSLDDALDGLGVLHYSKALNLLDIPEYWGVQVPVGLLTEAWRIREALGGAIQNEDVCRLAWLARNALELRVWAQYVATGPEAAKRFHQDGYVDAVETLKLMDRAFSALPSKYHELVHEAINPVLPEFDRVLVRDGVGLSVSELQKMKHLDPAKVAEEIGYGKVFARWNRMLSKMVHPTAYTVLVLRR